MNRSYDELKKRFRQSAEIFLSGISMRKEGSVPFGILRESPFTAKSAI